MPYDLMWNPVILIWFLPAIIGFVREVRTNYIIAGLNLFAAFAIGISLALTGLFWLFLLIWAMCGKTKSDLQRIATQDRAMQQLSEYLAQKEKTP
jgi:hypothetical protein